MKQRKNILKINIYGTEEKSSLTLYSLSTPSNKKLIENRVKIVHLPNTVITSNFINSESINNLGKQFSGMYYHL